MKTKKKVQSNPCINPLIVQHGHGLFKIIISLLFFYLYMFTPNIQKSNRKRVSLKSVKKIFLQICFQELQRQIEAHIETGSGEVLKIKRSNLFVTVKPMWQNICTTSCPSAGYSRDSKEHDGFFFVVVFPRYHLSYSAATGWLSWNLIYFLNFVNLVACLDGVKCGHHGPT